MPDRPNAPAVLRNRDAILRILSDELSGVQTVLEIGSGTGQHAVYFAAALPGIRWQTSDRTHNHAGIDAWIAESGLSNVRSPLDLDVSKFQPAKLVFDAVFSANTAHIMSAASVVDMLDLVGQILLPGGRFLLYGPFRVNGRFTSASNEQFDRSLKEQDESMGIRDLEWIDELATQQNMTRMKTYDMPANNLLVVWRHA